MRNIRLNEKKKKHLIHLSVISGNKHHLGLFPRLQFHKIT